MVRGSENGEARQRRSVFPTKQTLRSAQSRSRNDNGRSYTSICIAIGIIGLVIAYIMTQNRATQVAQQQAVVKDTEANQNEQDKARKPEVHGKPPPSKKTVKKKHATHKLLNPGASFTVGYSKTDENMAHIVDRVFINENSKLEMHRRLEVDDIGGLTLTETLMVIPDTLPDVFNTSDWAFDRKHLVTNYIKILLAASNVLGKLDGSANLLTVGLGGGMLNSYVRHNFDNVNVTAVEIDASMVNLARKYFGYVEDEKQHCVIDDGINFLQQCVEKNQKFDVIIIDACRNVVGLIDCPSEPFLNPEVTQSISKALNKDGVFMVNMLSLGEDITPLAAKKELFDKFFAECTTFQTPGSLNEEYICVKSRSRSKYLRSEKFGRDVVDQMIKMFYSE